MPNFACPGCTHCNLQNCLRCFDKKIEDAKSASGKRSLIEWQAQLITIFGPDNFASTIMSLGLIEQVSDKLVDFVHLRRQLLSLQEIYKLGLPEPSDRKVIEPASFRLIRFPTVDELQERFWVVEGSKFFREEELPVIWEEVDSEENVYYTRMDFHVFSGQLRDDLRYWHYRNVGALTDLTLRPHSNGGQTLEEHALRRFSPVSL